MWTWRQRIKHPNIAETTCNQGRGGDKCLYWRTIGDDGALGPELEVRTTMWLHQPRFAAAADAVVLSGATMYLPAFVGEVSVQADGRLELRHIAEGAESQAAGENPFVAVATDGAGRSVALEVEPRDGRATLVGVPWTERPIPVRRPADLVGSTVLALGPDGVLMLTRGASRLFVGRLPGGSHDPVTMVPATRPLDSHARRVYLWARLTEAGVLLLDRRGPTLEPLAEAVKLAEPPTIREDIGAIWSGAWTGAGWLTAWVTRFRRGMEVQVRMLDCYGVSPKE